MNLDFSTWYPWKDRETYRGIGKPGIYAIAITPDSLAGKAFSYRPDIVYVGMTNSQWGLSGRLWQFDLTISRKRAEHGGAERVLYKYPDYEDICRKLYVALWHIECDPSSDSPYDLRCMGEVARAEYECWARYKEEFGKLPEFNRKKDSPKYKGSYGKI